VIANFLIGLREGLEAALIVGILVAYVRKAGRTGVLPKLWIGIGIAIGAALATGAILTWGPYGLSFQAQEAIGGVLSIAAVGLVTWMIFWMARHARNLGGELRGQLDKALAGGAGAIVAIGVVAVGREGIETALFVWSNVQSEANALIGTLSAVAGIVIAVGLGYLVYRGAVRINLAKFFVWTGAVLVVVAAGVLAYGIGDLQEAGWIPFGALAFDLSAAVPPTSWYGTLLAGVFNFTPQPSWNQAIAWLAYLVIVLVAFLAVSRAGRHHTPDPQPVPTPTESPRLATPVA
jgi:high-affinity iron transporter